MGIDFARFSFLYFTHRLDQLQDSVGFLERSMAQQAGALQLKWEKLVDDLEEGEREFVQDEWSEEYTHYAEAFPQTVRKAFMVMQYSLLEGHLEKVCRAVATRANALLRTKDLSHKGVERSKTYLEKVIGLKLATDQQGWNHVHLIGRLRNLLVHSVPAGMGLEDMDRFKKKLSGIKHVRILPHEIVLGGEFLSYADGIYREVAREVDTAIHSDPRL